MEKKDIKNCYDLLNNYIKQNLDNLDNENLENLESIADILYQNLENLDWLNKK